MAKYHVSYKGEVGQCRAIKSCPFGDLEKDHFSSPDEARLAYETYAEATHQEVSHRKPKNEQLSLDLEQNNYPQASLFSQKEK